MSQRMKDGEQEKRLEIDLDAFENQVNQEIDSLFIPADQATPEIESPSQAIIEEKPPASDDNKAPPMPTQDFQAPENQSSGREEKKELDLSTFEIEVDKEIDSLFIPVEQASPEAESPPAVVVEEENLLNFGESGPTPVPTPEAAKVEQHDGKTDMSKEKLDFTAFEIQVDQEIDSLFVPGGEFPSAPKSPPAKMEQEEHLRTTSQVTSASVEAEWFQVSRDDDRDEKQMGIDFEALESQVNAEIDNLFIPTEHPIPVVEAPSKPMDGLGLFGKEGNTSSSASDMDFAGSDDPMPLYEDKDAAWIKTSKKLQEKGQQPLASKEPHDEFQIHAFQSKNQRELSALLESFYTAYLSLDWEFSVDNIAHLEQALAKLESYCQKTDETRSLYNILKSVLHRMRTQPDSISQPLTELTRDAQDLLRLLLTSHGEPDFIQKERLRALMGRFHFIREKSGPAKEVRSDFMAHEATPSYRPAVPEVSYPPYGAAPTEAPYPPTPFTRLGEFDWQSLTELKNWMETYHAHMEECLRTFEEENRRLSQLEGILSKRPALAPLTSRLSRIRSKLDASIWSFKSRGHEWTDRLEWLRSFQKDDEKQEALCVTQPVLESDSATPEDAVVHLTHAVSEEEKDSSEHQVCLFRFSGKQFAVPTSYVVKIEHLSSRKARKILKRGYATLVDFKPLFRSLKTGLFGVWWTGLPTQVLKGYRFFPLPNEVLGVSDPPKTVEGVILLSDGHCHGAVFTESAAINVRNKTIVKSSQEEDVLGTIEGKSGDAITVLDVESILKKLHQETAAEN